MKERPILYSAPMVRAVLEDRKTQTRRVCRGQRERSCVHDFQIDLCPYGQPGDRLWVREPFAKWHGQELFSGRPWPLTAYRAGRSWINGNCPGYARGETFWKAPDDKPEDVKWRPSIFMPRSASRILLEVTDVRVQRVQDISEKDALAEGVIHSTLNDPRVEFRWLWDSINAKRGFGWDANPWVWAITFRRIEATT